MELLKSILHPIHKEGYVFVVVFAIVSLFLGAFSEPLGWIGAIATAWCVYFFRNPDRVTPDDEGLVISPADGLVQKITKAQPPKELGMGEGELTRISIFLNVFNVHVNRVPVKGKITALHYFPGKFLNASLDKASVDNERQSVLITTEDGKQVACVQIAGLIARRIVCDLEENQEVKTGERFGIIRFGSRTDVYLPNGVNALVVEGQLAIGGETILADLNSSAPTRTGVRH
ncbi:MAG: phosphatidylserine decarboxylase [Rickettsiales bacterium]|jgi:phosphatidylserine decarboxylase|nr:phosphatidylserine decarboxylase [Rickettsiales bacterium]